MQPDPQQDQRKPENATDKTPKADMQAEDAGTAASGNATETGSGTASEAAMKQTSKTDSESGSGR